MVLWGRSVLGCQKVPRKVPPRFRGRFGQGSAKVSPRFRQGFTKVPPNFSKFRGVSGSLGQICLGLPKSSVEGSPRFHRGSTKVPSRFHQGSVKVPPRLHQGCTKVSPIRFHSAEWSLVEFHLKINRCCWGYSLGLFNTFYQEYIHKKCTLHVYGPHFDDLLIQDIGIYFACYVMRGFCIILLLICDTCCVHVYALIL